MKTSLVLALGGALFGITAHAAQPAKVQLATIRKAASDLKSIVRRTQKTGKNEIAYVAFEANLKTAKMSKLARRTLESAYLYATPGGVEGRVDPTRPGIINALSKSVARLAWADQKANGGNGDQAVSAAEAKTAKYWTPRWLFSYARTIK
jgi:hypothetical protein